MNEKNKLERKENEQENSQDVLNQDVQQTEEQEDIHFEHFDWTYNDSCC